MSTKSTLLLAPALAPLTGTDSLASAVRDLARALQEGGWKVTVAVGVDASDANIQSGLSRAGLARRLEPLKIGETEVVAHEGTTGDIDVLAFASPGAPDAATSLAAARSLGQTPDLLQLWTDTASALAQTGDLKTIVHLGDATTAEGLESADLILLSSKTAADAARKDAKSPLAGLASKLRGLAPGLDAREWNPERDSLLAQRMAPPTCASKAEAKAALRVELGLKDVDLPLIGVVSKIDKLPRSVGAELLSLPVQIAGLGAGPHIEALASRAPQQAACPRPLSDFEARQLRHRIVAAADFVLMPSKDEGSSQLFPCRYGTAVIAHNSGEPGERLVNFDVNTRTGSGFLYRNADELIATIRGAIAAWESGEETRAALIERCLQLDLSWQTTARRFDELVAPLL